MFRSLPVAERLYGEAELPPEYAGYARDTITLGWEARLKVRGRRRSDGGTEFGTSLPRGIVLCAGQWLVLDRPPLLIAIVEQPEPVFVIEPSTAGEWALYAYHLGNGHQPLMVTGTALICPDVPGVELLLQHYGIPHTRARRPFTPVSAVPSHQH
jgi:urease accessory protein UreE